MSEGVYGQDSDRKITVRVPDRVLEAYDDQCETLGTNRSERIRQHMRRAVGQNVEDIQPPEEEILSNGWKALKTAAEPDGTLPISVARTRVSEATRTKSEDAVRCVIKPLAERNYVELVTWGRIRVLGA